MKYPEWVVKLANWWRYKAGARERANFMSRIHLKHKETVEDFLMLKEVGPYRKLKARRSY